jgi:hypothetical protein
VIAVVPCGSERALRYTSRVAVKIHAMCLVRDEADILAHTLRRALSFCDAIHVYDNGSVDGSWELVLALAAQEPRIRPFKRDPRPFADAMRGEIWRRFGPSAAEGDWWCILDADEIYIDDPRAFLAALPPRAGQVWNASFQYYFTDLDRAAYEDDPSRYADALPPEQRYRYYLNNWSELRFFRHSRRLVWDEDARYPRPLGPVASQRIRLKHFQFRSPPQIQRRLDLRGAAPASFGHERRADWSERVFATKRDQPPPPPALREATASWEERIVPAARLIHDEGDGPYVLCEERMPRLPEERRPSLTGLWAVARGWLQRVGTRARAVAQRTRRAAPW